MVKKILFLLLILSIGSFVYSQDPDSYQRDTVKPKIPFRDRVYFGGGGGLMLGSIGYIQASPIAGYRLNAKASVGLGADLMYLFGNRINYFNYGGNAFTRYQLTDQFFVQGEYSVINTNTALQKREWVGTALAGLGYFPSSGVNISAYYILNYDPDRTPYITLPGLPIILRIAYIF